MLLRFTVPEPAVVSFAVPVIAPEKSIFFPDVDTVKVESAFTARDPVFSIDISPVVDFIFDAVPRVTAPL